MISEETVVAQLPIILSRLKRHDYAGYLSVRLSQRKYQERLTWLYGLFMELERIPFKVDEPMLGEIRLQWWRDQITKISRGEAVGHPIADGFGVFLREALSYRDGEQLLPIIFKMIESFLFEVRRAPVQSKDELHDIFDHRYGGLIRAGLIICEKGLPQNAALCREAGIAIGMTVMMSDLPRILHKGIMPLPQDVLKEFDLFHEDFMQAEKNGLKNKAFDKILDDTVKISWDIKKRFSEMARAERVFFARWLLVPSLLQKALEDRAQNEFNLTRINPLKVFFVMWRGNF